MNLTQKLLQPWKGLLGNIGLLIIYLISIALFAASVNVRLALQLVGIHLDGIIIFLMQAGLFLLCALLQLYVLGAIGIFVKSGGLSGAGFLSTLSMGVRILIIALPYYAIYLTSLFFYGRAALTFTIVYLVILVLLMPAILRCGTQKILDGWNLYHIIRQVLSKEYAIALGVGIIALFAYYGIIRTLNLVVFLIASALQASIVQYAIINGVNFLIIGLIALIAVLTYLSIFADEKFIAKAGSSARLNADAKASTSNSKQEAKSESKKRT